MAYVRARELVEEQLRASEGGTLDGGVGPAASLLVAQFVVTAPFTLDLVYVPGGCDAADCAAALEALSATALSRLIDERQAAFEAAADARLGLGEVAPATRAFAHASLAAVLGSVGYFYGASQLASAAGPRRSSPAALLSVVPSRPFFPRGFLWDEGFHQLVVGAYAPALADDILAHWLGLMHADGWIPREQILGAEAESRVPSEFVAQHRLHANPPALILRLEALVRAVEPRDAAARRSLQLARRLWPRLKRWYRWFVRTQAGAAPGTFRWRGRDPADGRLNALTLSSGLDDYPRATVPTDDERHIDLLCWIALFSRMLAQLATALELPEEAASFAAAHARQLAALTRYHWHDGLKAFCDWGHHANGGEFRTHYVGKCGAADGSSIEHDFADPQRPSCPASHPRFLFPLGDGRGGVLTRERFVPRALRDGWVEHLGYVSLFPLMLRLLPPDAPQLPHLLDLLADPRTLWSPYGLRSLSAADRFADRANAPGDEPYWRGPIWINLNYLALGGLRHYADAAGPVQARAAELYAQLRANLVGNMQAEWERTGWLWEQYSPSTGRGQRNHPFNGWSALVLLMIAEIY